MAPQNSTLLELAHRAWQSQQKNPEVAATLAASGLYTSYEIFQITKVRVTAPVNLSRGRLNPATLMHLTFIALAHESGAELTGALVQEVLDNGTTRSVIERLTGYDTRNSGRVGQASDGTSDRDSAGDSEGPLP